MIKCFFLGNISFQTAFYRPLAFSLKTKLVLVDTSTLKDEYET